jgi:hypothetical protein
MTLHRVFASQQSAETDMSGELGLLIGRWPPFTDQHDRAQMVS